MINRRIRLTSALLASSALLLAGCASEADGDPIRITGSATVEPITQLAATEHRANISMTSDGTYDGFENFCSGESDINNASSAITQEYIDQCAENDIRFVELPIGLDALSIVANEANTDVFDLTLEELGAIWEPDSTVTSWSDVREGLSDENVTLVGRPDGSGTFSYFTAQVTGEQDAIRDDYQKTDDMDELSAWIADEPNALGFMGVGNYLAASDEDRAKMKTLSVDGVDPTLKNVQNGDYQPLARPLFIYVNVDSLENNAAVEDFVSCYIDNATSILPRVYFYALPEEAYDVVSNRLEQRTEGSLLDGDPFQSIDIVDALNS